LKSSGRVSRKRNETGQEGGKRRREGRGKRGKEVRGGRREGEHTRSIKLYRQLDLVDLVDDGNEGQVLLH
jgi:hypothetical protein